MTGIDVFETVITCLSPIIIAIIGFMQARRDKSNKEYRELREKYDREKEAQAVKEKEESDKVLEEIQKSIATMTEEIAELKAIGQHHDINKELEKLVQATTINYEYSQSLSGVVEAIGSSLQKTDMIQHDEIDVALAKHRDTDRELKKKLYKALY